MSNHSTLKQKLEHLDHALQELETLTARYVAQNQSKITVLSQKLTAQRTQTQRITSSLDHVINDLETALKAKSVKAEKAEAFA